MTAAHLTVLAVCLIFMAVATGLAAFGRRLGARPVGASLWRKYPLFIGLIALFLAASWLPAQWHLLTALLAGLGGLAVWELARALLPAGRAPGRVRADGPDGRSTGGKPGPPELRLLSGQVAPGQVREEGPTGRSRRPRVGRLLSGAAAAASPLLCAALIAAADGLPAGVLFPLWLGVGLAAGLWAALAGPPEELGRRLLAVAGGVVYLPLCLAAYVWVRRADPGGFHAVFLYLIVAANDSFSQITGQVFGRRLLAARLSPGKTVEGAVGGLLLAALMGAALGPITGWGWAGGLLAGAVVALAGTLGDLAESAWKRALGLKDFSALLGAQGGVLDRFDGLILAAPIYFLLLSLLVRM